MVLGALIDAGVPLADVRRALGSLAIAPDAVWTEPVSRAGIRATKFCVRGEDPVAVHAHQPAQGHEHAHDHDDVHDDDHGHHRHDHAHEGHTHTYHPVHAEHHVHRTLSEISQLIEGSALSAGGK